MIAKLVLIALACTLAAAVPARRQNTYASLMPRVQPRAGYALPARPDGRIVGGNEATVHAFPHQAGLIIDGRSFCGGSLISEQYVLTAAHCTTAASSIEVTLGDHDRNVDEGTEVVLTSSGSNIITHGEYGSFRIKNDIALIRLPEAVTFNSYIQPVALPTSDPAVGTDVQLSGWGKDSDEATAVTSVMREVVVPVLDNQSCDDVYGSITDSQICIDSSNGKGVCNGDSGGPMNSIPTGTTYGVASFVSSSGCAAGDPHAFTRVSSFVDWIEANSGVTV